MTKLALLSAGLVATAMLVGPVAAREHHNVQRHVAVGTAPWDNGPPPYYAGPGYY